MPAQDHSRILNPIYQIQLLRVVLHNILEDLLANKSELDAILPLILHNQSYCLFSLIYNMMWAVVLLLVIASSQAPTFFENLAGQAKQPLFARSLEVGKTVQSNPLIIHVLTKIKFVEVDELFGRNAIMIDSYMHAREPYSLQMMQRLAASVLDRAKTAQIDYFLNYGVFIFFPFVNADGYELYSKQAAGVGDIRKNMNIDVKCVSGAGGVDINRNFPSSFGTLAQSSIPCSEQYHGKAPFSQAEADIFRQIFTNFTVLIAIDIHSYGNEWIYPYAADASGSKVKQHALYPFYRSIERQFSARNRKMRSCIDSLGYVADGVYIDWALDQGALAFAFEVGSSFHSDSQKDIQSDITKAIDDFYLLFRRTSLKYETAIHQNRIIVKSKSLAKMQITVTISDRSQELQLLAGGQAEVKITPTDTHAVITNTQSGESEVVSLKLRNAIAINAFTIVCVMTVILGGLLLSFYTRWRSLKRRQAASGHTEISLSQMPTVHE